MQSPAFEIPREVEKQHFVDEQTANRDTNWLAVFPEAEEYILTKSFELKREIEEIQTAWNEHLLSVPRKPLEEEHEFRLYFISALYFAEINKRATQLHHLASTVRRHAVQTKDLNQISSRQGFSAEEIETAREMPLVSLFESNGNVLKRLGVNFITLCPFHDEKTPSCVIYCNNNRYYCFGCNAKGNPIDYLMIRYHLTFQEAVRSLLGGRHA